MRPPRPSTLGFFLYWLGYVFFSLAFRVIWRRRVVGQEKIPRRGALIFASNHVSMADPPAIGSAIPRMIHFMAKQELFDVPVLGWFIRRVNAFPIRRAEHDMSAFKTAQRILKSGGALILFPEGSRQKHGRLGRPKAGVGMLAHFGKSPVVPVYVHNTQHLSRFKKLTVCFGEPLDPPREPDYAAFSHKVMESIRRLEEVHLGHRN